MVDEFYDPIMWLWRKIFGGKKEQRQTLQELPVVANDIAEDEPLFLLSRRRAPELDF